MLRSLTSGVSAMQQFQEQMDVIGNDIANVNTTGFKSASVQFSDALSQNLEMTGSGGSTQIGTGVTTAAITNEFTQGAINTSDGESKLAIIGNGFFQVRDATNGLTYATRDGEFRLDGYGYLITSSGLRVQGYSDPGLSTLGDIQIDGTGGTSSSSTISGYKIGTDGKITVTSGDAPTQSFIRGQVLLQNFTSPETLVKEGDNLYSNLSAAGPMSQPAAPNTSGLGKIASNSLEASNVDLTTEFSDMITAQRAFEASSKIITTSDEMLQTLVNLKR